VATLSDGGGARRRDRQHEVTVGSSPKIGGRGEGGTGWCGDTVGTLPQLWATEPS
jgi:hypothetical protein